MSQAEQCRGSRVSGSNLGVTTESALSIKGRLNWTRFSLSLSKEIVVDVMKDVRQRWKGKHSRQLVQSISIHDVIALSLRSCRLSSKAERKRKTFFLKTEKIYKSWNFASRLKSTQEKSIYLENLPNMKSLLNFFTLSLTRTPMHTHAHTHTHTRSFEEGL